MLSIGDIGHVVTIILHWTYITTIVTIGNIGNMVNVFTIATMLQYYRHWSTRWRHWRYWTLGQNITILDIWSINCKTLSQDMHKVLHFSERCRHKMLCLDNTGERIHKIKVELFLD